MGIDPEMGGDIYVSEEEKDEWRKECRINSILSTQIRLERKRIKPFYNSGDELVGMWK
jgi:hypothetical protein